MGQSTIPDSFIVALLAQAYPQISLLSAASNIQTCASNPPYTVRDFMEFYPRFGLVPQAVIQAYITLANANIGYARWESRWFFGMCYYVAHYCTLYDSVMHRDSESTNTIGQDGMGIGLLTAEKLEDTEFHYDTKTLTDTAWGQFNATEFGKLYITEAKLVGMGGMYVS